MSQSSSSFVVPGRKKDEWRKQAAGFSLLTPEKRPRTKDDDEQEW